MFNVDNDIGLTLRDFTWDGDIRVKNLVTSVLQVLDGRWLIEVDLGARLLGTTGPTILRQVLPGRGVVNDDVNNPFILSWHVVDDFRVLARVGWRNRWRFWRHTWNVWYWFIWRYLCDVSWVSRVLWSWCIWNWVPIWINWNNLTVSCIGNCDRVVIISILDGCAININFILAIPINIRNVVAIDKWCLFASNILTSS